MKESMDESQNKSISSRIPLVDKTRDNIKNKKFERQNSIKEDASASWNPCKKLHDANQILTCLICKPKSKYNMNQRNSVGDLERKDKESYLTTLLSTKKKISESNLNPILERKGSLNMYQLSPKKKISENKLELINERKESLKLNQLSPQKKISESKIEPEMKINEEKKEPQRKKSRASYFDKIYYK